MTLRRDWARAKKALPKDVVKRMGKKDLGPSLDKVVKAKQKLVEGRDIETSLDAWTKGEASVKKAQKAIAHYAQVLQGEDRTDEVEEAERVLLAMNEELSEGMRAISAFTDEVREEIRTDPELARRRYDEGTSRIDRAMGF